MSRSTFQSSSQLVTVLIALRNDRQGLAKTLASLVNQPNADAFRILVIDCNSLDFPIDVVREYKKRMNIDFYVGHDRGIYHSWNRGLRLVSTQWVTFFGAGDLFLPNAATLLVEAAKCEDAADVISSKSENLYPRGRIEVRGDPFNALSFARFFTINHSGTLYRTSIFAEYGNFDENYRSSGDYDFLLRIRNRARFGFIDAVISQYIVGGISSSSTLPLKETFSIRKKYKTVSTFENWKLRLRGTASFYYVKLFR
jgi:glycosyltransferase involved in cell wall biosynthesis